MRTRWHTVVRTARRERRDEADRPPLDPYDPGVRNEWDAIVVGLGAIGSGAAYWLSRRLDDRVLGVEQYALGHSNGAGQDHSRIIRLSYHRPDYGRLARRAYEAWAEVERESGATILTRTGGL